VQAYQRIIITGSSGLIGSCAARYFDRQGWRVFGIDNNGRAEYFGPEGGTLSVRQSLIEGCNNYTAIDVDVSDRHRIQQVVSEIQPAAIIHAAAQPSHDFSRKNPQLDFDVNAVGTVNILEAARRSAPDCVFVFLSSSKVYGDRINGLKLVEHDTRFEFADLQYANGVTESFSIDQSMHSIYGASKASADLMVQEYGKYFGLLTTSLRANCMTGIDHAGVELHGFLNYIVKCAVIRRPYTVFGYSGKQVRDQLDSLDVVRAIDLIIKSPPQAGEVYNIGGGRENSASILECVQMLEQRLGRPMDVRFSPDARVGDHCCYYTNTKKLYK